ncbi:dihydroxyacetone kinase subunit DhaK [Feifania hominis]|uniref:phosphoenolpyruvate--glycerone phosphotransferase n=1 Tax=Feifania hominis TaxID=2763660 RepID=A0A926DDA8_9FIRM|nr:dihydroxyacetone kinase subunit DhaK [Feifania hominis]MBC8536101.1 dihydroxyacetone kinase subunit DhaK [Feifania hominis]
MKKMMNAPENFVDEMLEGILAAHPDMLTTAGGDLRCIITEKGKRPGRVAITTGGGSGHLPVFLGYVGDGMIDGCSVGNVFASPSANQMLSITKAIDNGAGVLYIYGNYGGDIMNFDMAAEMADMDDIEVQQVIVADDVLSAPKGSEDKRRGIAGMFFAYKIAGAAANEIRSLDEVKAVTERALAGVRTVGVGLSPCIIPEKGKPGFTIGDDEMEIGMGIHGEPGIRREKMKSADEIVEEIMDKLLPDVPYESGDEVAVLVNGLGGTPLEELYIIYRKVNMVLKEKGIRVHRPYIGEFATSMEMAGMSITLMKLDDELKALLDAPAETPFFVQK